MSTTVAIDESLLSTCQEYAEKALKRLQENFELLLGQGVKLEVEALGVERDDALRKRLPSDAVALSVALEGKDFGPSLLMMDPPLAHAMLAVMRIAPTEEIERAWAEGGTDVSDEDLASLDEIGGFLAAALTDELRARIRKCELTFQSGGAKLLEQNAWKEGEDPMGAEPYLVADVGIALGGKQPVACVFAIPHALMEDVVQDFRRVQVSDDADDASGGSAAETPDGAPAPEAVTPSVREPSPPPQAVTAPAAAPAAPVGTPAEAVDAPEAAAAAPGLTLLWGAQELVEPLGQALGVGVVHIEQISQFMAQLEADAAPDVVFAQVPAGEEKVLPLIGALARQPQMQGHVLVVLLDAPTRSTVTRCAHLGLWNVLPTQEESGIIASRVQQLLQRRQAS